MSCDSNDDELKLTKEYKYLLSYIRPLIDQLEKSKDAQLCLLWLSKLEQCASREKYYRNKILFELCKQVKANCLKPPFNVSPPNGSLRNVIRGDWEACDWDTNDCSDMDAFTQEGVSCSSLSSFNTSKSQAAAVPWKETHLCGASKNKQAKSAKEPLDHSKCFAIQKAYQERAQSDQLVIEKYHDIIKSLVSQQLKADISPSRLKKLQATYEAKMAELLHTNKRVQLENEALRRKLEELAKDLKSHRDLKSQNEDLKKQMSELESVKNSLETKLEQNEEGLLTVRDLMSKLSETEAKLKESEKRCELLQQKVEEDRNNSKKTQQCEMEKENSVKLSDLERMLEEKQMEISTLKEQMSSQCAQFEQELSQWKQEQAENSNPGKDKRKIKTLKNKAKKLEKVQEHMSVLFQSHLQQILAKKDFYIASLEMQLKRNHSNSVDNSDFNNALNGRISHLENMYKKLLEESEQQALVRRQQDLQKIHALEKQLLICGGKLEAVAPDLDQLTPNSITSPCGPGSELRTETTVNEK